MSDAPARPSDGGPIEPAEMPAEPLALPGAYQGNPVGLSEDACRAIGPDLDRHLATYGVLYHQYHKHHWLVTGPQFRDLHLFFQEHYEEVHLHFDRLAERLTALGYVPTCRPSEQERIAYVRHEPEGHFRIREMLELDLEAEAAVAQRLRETITRCFQHGDHGTRAVLEPILAAAEDRAHHIEHYLEADTLELGNIVEVDSLRA